MAYWERRLGNKVYVYSKRTGRAVQLPRSQTRHLDNKKEKTVEAWVQSWAFQNESFRLKKTNSKELGELRDLFIKFLYSRKKSEGTIRQYSSFLDRYIFTFFLSHGMDYSDPNYWPDKSIFLLNFLQDKKLKLSESSIKRVNIVLRGFWKFLFEENYVQTESLKLRNPVIVDSKTPLKFTITPDQVLSFVNNCSRLDLKILALGGYFFSLRPQEVFAMNFSKFRAGNEAEKLEASIIMGRSGLFNRLVYFCDLQRDNQGILKEPKSYSKGWVSCFNKEAAQILVGLINENEELIFPDNRAAYRLWKKFGIEGLSLKDLRRSSIYWLGHHTEVQPLQLMKHARHKSIETTMLYVRSPETFVESEKKGILSL